MLTPKEIERALLKTQPPGSNLHFDHKHEAVLWFDIRNNDWCMSFYIVHNDQVEVDPAPTMCFTKAAP